MAFTAASAQARFHLSGSTLVAQLRKVSPSSELALAQNPRYKPIS